MSDERLRGLERRFKETGSVEDEAAWLLGRVRAGELTHDDLVLAAYFKHPASLRCIPSGTRLDEPWPTPSSFKNPGLKGITRFSKEARVRMAIAAAHAGLMRAETQYRRRPPVSFDLASSWHALFAAEAWAVCPCRRHAGLAREAAEAVEHPRAPGWGYALSAQAAARAAWRSPTKGAREAYLHAGEHEEGQAAIEGEVVPWALGRADAVRERVVARQEVGSDG